MPLCGCCCLNSRHSKLRSHPPRLDVHDESASDSKDDSITIGYIDEHGFVVSNKQKKVKMIEIGSTEHRNNIRKLNERTQKWLHMLDNWETFTTIKKTKLKSRIRKGIPTPLRAKIWKRIIGVSALTNQQLAYYSKLKGITPNEKIKLAIDNDIDRIFPRHILFTKQPSSPSGGGRESLRNILYAYANHDEEVGYAQGMGFIAALFLMLMTEEDAFCCLSRLLDQNGAYQLRELYLEGLPLLNCRYYQFNQLLLKFLPKVYNKIAALEITPVFYASTWFITIFCYQFPFDFVYRIWDIYLHEGIKVVFRVGLALMKMNQVDILRMDTFGEMMEYLQDMHNYMDTQKAESMNIDELLNEAFGLSLKNEHLEQIQREYNQKRLAQQRMDGRDVSATISKGRDVSEMEPSVFLKKISQTKQELQESVESFETNDKIKLMT